jgi:hypothetical protein
MLGERWAMRYPCFWLVWEPGAWAPAFSEAHSVAKTQLPGTGHSRPRGSDPLCFPLHAKQDAVVYLQLGRAPENDLVVDDMTVSRTHLTLYHTKGWWAAHTADGSSVMLGSQPLVHGAPQWLRPGVPLTVGAVHFSFYDPASFVTRVTQP